MTVCSFKFSPSLKTLIFSTGRKAQVDYQIARQIIRNALATDAEVIRAHLNF